MWLIIYFIYYFVRIFIFIFDEFLFAHKNHLEIN